MTHWDQGSDVSTNLDTRLWRRSYLNIRQVAHERKLVARHPEIDPIMPMTRMAVQSPDQQPEPHWKQVQEKQREMSVTSATLHENRRSNPTDKTYLINALGKRQSSASANPKALTPRIPRTPQSTPPEQAISVVLESISPMRVCLLAAHRKHEAPRVYPEILAHRTSLTARLPRVREP
ncbi:MAG TPA: hypothetical protein DCY79_05325 [Planctomycetaceae bacterium]|nr:hypothetical protein [Blastopirellula sp.]HAY79210.1 hypothetical protein [Planctomycetaceae bacterium]